METMTLIQKYAEKLRINSIDLWLRSIETAMLGITSRNKIRNTDLRKRTKIVVDRWISRVVKTRSDKKNWQTTEKIFHNLLIHRPFPRILYIRKLLMIIQNHSTMLPNICIQQCSPTFAGKTVRLIQYPSKTIELVDLVTHIIENIL